MFTTGSYDTLQVRIHRSQSGADITAYQAEALSYSGISGLFYVGCPSNLSGLSGVVSALPNLWERELQHKYREINGSGYTGIFLTT